MIETWQKCSKLYDHRYRQRSKKELQIPQQPAIIGSIAHKTIEYHLQEGSTISLAFSQAAVDILQDFGMVFSDQAQAFESGSALDLQVLEFYAKEYGHLLHRASPAYQGTDPIRNADGTIPKDPAGFPPKTLRKAYEDLNLSEYRSDLDTVAAMVRDTFSLISVADAAATAYAFAQNFYLPNWIQEIRSVEEALGEGLTLRNREWKAYSDLIVRTVDGEIAVIDFKSGKDRPTQETLGWHPQLNLYCKLYQLQYGAYPRYFGIGHLPSGQYLMTKANPDRIEETYSWYREQVDQADEQAPARAFPTSYNSPCINFHYKTKAITDVCPYLRHCWRSFYKSIEPQLPASLQEHHV